MNNPHSDSLQHKAAHHVRADIHGALAYDDNGNLIRVTQPEDIEPEEENNVDELFRVVAIFTEDVDRWILSTAQRLDDAHIGRRFKMAVYCKNPRLLDYPTQAEMAREAGLTRAALSKIARSFMREFDIPGLLMRSSETVERCREAQRRKWEKKKAAGTHQQPLDEKDLQQGADCQRGGADQ